MENEIVIRSAWWFLLPIFFGVVGSAITWAKIRGSNDHELLKWVMIFGIAQTIAIALGGMYAPTESMSMTHMTGALP